MTNKPRHPHRKSLSQKLAKLFRPWHRRIGIISVIFVILVALTGMLINHSHHLALDSMHVKQKWLLDHYSIKAPEQTSLFSLSPVLASTDNLLWQADTQLLEAANTILSAVEYQGLIIAIDSNYLYLISQQGELLEKQDRSTGLPSDLKALAVMVKGDDSELWLNSDNGIYLADSELIEWHTAKPNSQLQWQIPIKNRTNHSVIEKITQQARASHLTWERVLLDLHSGRIIGLSGPWLMDIVALSLILMAISGLYLWWQTKPKKRKTNN
jgi:hypothetical protein